MTITPDTAIISFRTERASVELGATHEGASRRSVFLALKLDTRENVETAERRSLKAVEWSINLYEGSEFNAHAKQQQAIGFLSHHPQSKSDYDYSAESCHGSVALESGTFAPLWNLFVSNRVPDLLSITVKDITYGDDPEGREKIWDVTNKRSVGIVEASFRFLVAGTPILSDASGNYPDAVLANLPATSNDVQASANHLAKTVADLQASVVSYLRYLVAIASLIAIYMLFRL